MSILKVANMGHPVLRLKAKPIKKPDLASGELRRLVADMLETMREYDGVGLAAPQVHASVRLVVVGSEANPRYPGAPVIPVRILVNPVVTPLTDETIRWWEGCLSVPGLRGLVIRPRKVKVRALDISGAPVSFTAEGFEAVVVQHETDHLDGFLYPDRMKDIKKLVFEREYGRFHEPAEDDKEEGKTEG
jgi:peptide deformylase